MVAAAIACVSSTAYADDAPAEAAATPASGATVAPAPAPSAPAFAPVPVPTRSESPPTSDPSAPYVPHGFTMALGLGLSHTAIGSDLASRERSDLGLAPLSLNLGGFLSPRVALMARMAGTSVFREDARNKAYQVVNGFYGPSVQYWATDSLFLGGGVGLAVLATNPLMSVSRENRFTEVGVGANARLGWAFALPGKSAFSLVLDLYGSRFEQSGALASALNIEWQLR